MERDNGGGEKPDCEDWLTTGDMARLSQTTLRTVRFYEEEGLIASREREDGCHRKFPPSELKKLQIISDLREAGFSLQDVKDLMALKGTCLTAKQAASRMSSTLCSQLSTLERRIEVLQRVRAELSSMVGLLKVCHDCPEPDFPGRCRDCHRVDTTGAERATQLLWKN